jgi:hypothetical protein
MPSKVACKSPKDAAFEEKSQTKPQAQKNLRTPPFPTQTGQQNHLAGTLTE